MGLALLKLSGSCLAWIVPAPWPACNGDAIVALRAASGQHADFRRPGAICSALPPAPIPEEPPMSLFDLTGRVALVTGGNGGIGLGMARGLAQAGAAIAVAGRNQAKSETAATELSKLGVKTAVIAVDVTDEAQCCKMVDDTLTRLGRLDILINNAGINVRKQPQEYTSAEWKQVIETNLTSAFSCSQAVYPTMKAAGGGKIINIGSMLSIFGAPFAAAYGASKGGIVQLTKALASSWAKDNIQVNAVLPGWIDTDLTRNAREQVKSLNTMVLMRTPAGRWGVPNDLSGIAAFLASPAPDFITGPAIPVGGGSPARAAERRRAPPAR